MKRNAALPFFLALLGALVLFPPSPCLSAEPPRAGELIRQAFDHLRGKASVAEVSMTIHRPDWQRSVAMKAWTKGRDQSFITITSPAKDQGNSTLKKGQEMWIFNPKVNRVIKLPPSMMSQSWMGSDFSNNDLAKTDSILHDYEHTLVKTETIEGHTVYTIKSLPRPRAPVVWGMQMLKVRDDLVFLQQSFFDEDLKLVKTLDLLDIRMLGDRLYPAKWRMGIAGEEGRYTLVEYHSLEFRPDLPESLFTLSHLRSPGR